MPRKPISNLAPAPPTEPARLLYLDDRLAVIAKPAGLSLATPRAASDQAVERLRAALVESERALLGGALWLIHRLDVGTSGLVAVARDAEMHRDLVAAFGERRVRKNYQALVWGHPRPREGVFDAALGPDRQDRRRMVPDPSGRAARTRYRVLGVAPHVAWLDLEPETGRTHQIRVHLAAAGHPIVGDDLYGGPRHHGVKDRRIRATLAPPHTLLHARCLTLPAPPLCGPLEVEAPLPEAFLAALAAVGVAA